MENKQTCECKKCGCVWQRDFAFKFQVMMSLMECPMCMMDGEN